MYPFFPVGVVFVPLRVQDWCWLGPVRPAEGLFEEPKEVCALALRPGHGLQCGGLGGVVGDRGLIEDVDAGVGFRRRWLLGVGDRGGGPLTARALSGVEEVNDTVSCGCLATLPLGLWQRPCIVDFARVLGAGDVLCVGGAYLYGDHLRPFWSRQSSMVRPTFLLLVVAGSHLTWMLLVPYAAVPMSDFTRGPYSRGGAPGRGVFEGQLYSGTYGVVGVQGGGFLRGATFWLRLWLWRGFDLCRGFVFLCTLAATGIGLCSFGSHAPGLLCRCLARCEHGVLMGGVACPRGAAFGGREPSGAPCAQ